MIEVHGLPTAIPYQVEAEWTHRVKGKTVNTQTLNPVVFYTRTGLLETGLVGTKYKLQISLSVLSDKPELNDTFKIGDREYGVISVIEKRNPGMQYFWELEIKSKTTNKLT
jgi:hypothetical protein